MDLHTLNNVLPNLNLKKQQPITRQEALFTSGNIKLQSLNNDTISFGSAKKTEAVEQTKKPFMQRVKDAVMNFIRRILAIFKPDHLQKAENKMTAYVQEKLRQANFKPGTPLKIITTKENMPFAKLMAKEAYKMGSGEVYVKKIDPELDKFTGEKFEYEKKKDAILESKGIVNLDLGDAVSAYKDAKLTPAQTEAVKGHYFVQLDDEAHKLLEQLVDPKEVLVGKLGLKPGQPLMIQASREQEPLVLKLAEYAHNVLGSKTVEVFYDEGRPNHLGRIRTENASEQVIKEIPEWTKDRFQEYIDKQVARLILRGPDPYVMKGVSDEKMALESKAGAEYSKTIKFYREDNSTQWCIYYAPTTKSAVVAYPEYVKGEVPTKEEALAALKHAAKDAFAINRVGKAEAHFANLQRVADIMNEQKFDKIRFLRKDPQTGKVLTDLKIGMMPKDKFICAEEKTVPNNPGEEPVTYVANCPTEEVFASPDNMNVQGFVTATLPLSLQGKIIKDLYVEFDNTGKIIQDKIDASENAQVFRDHVKNYDGADRLGEVALVADSPIAKTGRLFLDTLLDENATCHIAIGGGFAECLEGASKISNPEELKKFKEENHCNISDTHVDFMIGGPDMLVQGVHVDDDGKETYTTLIEKDQFQI